MYTTQHPDNLFCPICGCAEIYYWPELEYWYKMTKEEKQNFEKCPACLYGTNEFPYEAFD